MLIVGQTDHHWNIAHLYFQISIISLRVDGTSQYSTKQNWEINRTSQIFIKRVEELIRLINSLQNRILKNGRIYTSIASIDYCINSYLILSI